jgi:hypothetical protein
MNENQAFENELNEHQHRALSRRLSSIERELYKAERLLKGDLANGELFETTSDITEAEAAELLTIIGAARQVIAELKRQFALTRKTEAVRAWLLGHFSIIWTILEDCHSNKLQGFGEVSPQLSQSLDPKIDQLITLVNSISQRVTIQQ